MAAIDNLINVTIAQGTAAVSTASFGIPLILGTTSPSTWGDDVVRVYNAPAALLADGFTTESPEYKAALAMYSGSTTPVQFMVGKRTSGTAAADLSAIFAQNNDAYGIVGAGLPDADVLAIAAVVEGLKKIYIASSASADIAKSGSADLGSKLKAAGYTRTGLVYTTQNVNGTLESAWIGSQLPQTPGSNNWAYKSLNGITVDALSGSQLSVLYGSPVAEIPGKNVNTYQMLANVPVTFPGMAASGRFFDITIGIDWLQANIQSAVFSLLANTLKVPYTDAGAGMIMAAVNGVLQLAVANGLLAGDDADYPVYVSADPVGTVSKSQRALRQAPTVKFGGRLQGAFNSVAIQGTIEV